MKSKEHARGERIYDASGFRPRAELSGWFGRGLAILRHYNRETFSSYAVRSYKCGELEFGRGDRDGSQHLEQEAYDEERTKYLESQGYRVLRFWNHQVTNDIDGVIRAIIFAVETDTRL